VELRGGRLLRELDVRLQAHLHAVQGPGGEASGAPEPFLLPPVDLLRGRERIERRAGGLHHDLAPGAIDRHQGARGICRVASLSPATAGMPSERAMMAVW